MRFADGVPLPDAHEGMSLPSTDTTTLTCGAVTTTSAPCWSSRSTLSARRHDANCVQSSHPWMTRFSGARSTTPSRHLTFHGGSAESNSDPLSRRPYHSQVLLHQPVIVTKCGPQPDSKSVISAAVIQRISRSPGSSWARATERPPRRSRRRTAISVATCITAQISHASPFSSAGPARSRVRSASSPAGHRKPPGAEKLPTPAKPRGTALVQARDVPLQFRVRRHVR